MSTIAERRKLLVADVMTENPVVLSHTTTVREAAAQMREHNIGDVLLVDGDSLVGIATDRDIVTRAVALGRDPETTTLAEVATMNPEWVRPDLHAADAMSRMKTKAIHRLPVLEHGRVVGIVSLGDLLVRLEERSAASGVFAGQHAHDE